MPVRLATRFWADGTGPDGTVAAAAPLALLIHGVTSSSRTWWRVAPELAHRGYRVLGVDLRGHGASPGAGDGLVLDDLTGDVLETLRLPAIDLLVGHSLGAVVALDLLAKRPGLARRLVIEEPPGPAGVDWESLADGIQADGRRAREEPEAMRRELALSNPAWDPEEVDRRLADLAACDADGIANALRRTRELDVAALARAVGVPTLLMAGLENLGSALVGPDRSALVDALAGRAAFQVLDEGHNLHRDAFPRFMEVLGRWLEGTAWRG